MGGEDSRNGRGGSGGGGKPGGRALGKLTDCSSALGCDGKGGGGRVDNGSGSGLRDGGGYTLGHDRGGGNGKGAAGLETTGGRGDELADSAELGHVGGGELLGSCSFRRWKVVPAVLSTMLRWKGVPCG